MAVAAHIASQSEDLKRLARKHQLATLAYLLDMARLEAETACRTQAPAET
ncbi:hypothetical protein [Chenggangzhangella methanolivorans]|uniref:Uncharacterized protein n=1 Tax=Chenggangzhangella methanolivorans TaxID=1437009 RepID=A0A9E6UGF7_9HYPH|nr:hypothetical protein [Chenggangzhangella methanolivorans]QZN98682.1 hypothetical protein K6K41_16905 [Chenggangzhangella methanolivorans]